VDLSQLRNKEEGKAKNYCTIDNMSARRVWRDMSSALAYLHRQDLLHNDIKPGNIMWHDTRGAVLIDFGLASSTSDFGNGGSPTYVAPEWMYHGTRDATSDIYALGLTMLWAFKYLPLPDTYAIVEYDGYSKLDWQIQTVRNALADPAEFELRSEKSQKEIRACVTWLKIISDILLRLPIREPVPNLLVKCIKEESQSRPTAAQLHRLFASGGPLGRDLVEQYHPSSEHQVKTSSDVHDSNDSALVVRNVASATSAVNDPTSNEPVVKTKADSSVHQVQTSQETRGSNDGNLVIRNVTSATSDVKDPASKAPVVQSAEFNSSGTQLVSSEHYARYEINREVVQSSSANSAGTEELSSEHFARYKPNKPVTPVVRRSSADSAGTEEVSSEHYARYKPNKPSSSRNPREKHGRSSRK